MAGLHLTGTVFVVLIIGFGAAWAARKMGWREAASLILLVAVGYAAYISGAAVAAAHYLTHVH